MFQWIGFLSLELLHDFSWFAWLPISKDWGRKTDFCFLTWFYLRIYAWFFILNLFWNTLSNVYWFNHSSRFLLFILLFRFMVCYHPFGIWFTEMSYNLMLWFCRNWFLLQSLWSIVYLSYWCPNFLEFWYVELLLINYWSGNFQLISLKNECSVIFQVQSVFEYVSRIFSCPLDLWSVLITQMFELCPDLFMCETRLSNRQLRTDFVSFGFEMNL